MMNGKNNNGSHGLDTLDFKVRIRIDDCFNVDFHTVILRIPLNNWGFYLHDFWIKESSCFGFTMVFVVPLPKILSFWLLIYEMGHELLTEFRSQLTAMITGPSCSLVPR